MHIRSSHTAGIRIEYLSETVKVGRPLGYMTVTQRVIGSNHY